MISIEIVFWMIVITFGLLGFSRGWSREVGSTIGILLAMLIIARFGPILAGLTNQLGSAAVKGGPLIQINQASPSRFWFYTLLFLVITYAAYQGETLALDIKGGRAQESILGLFNGLINGYLIAGNVWYFLQQNNYQALGPMITPPTAPRVMDLIRFLPPAIMPEPVVLVVLILLLLLRIIK